MDGPSKATGDVKTLIQALFAEAEGRSLHALLARHGRERLFVPPLLWDHRQPALLQCRFLPRARPAPLLPPSPPIPEELWAPSLPHEETWFAQDLHETADASLANSLLDSRYLVDEYGGYSGCFVGYASKIAPGVIYLAEHIIRSRREMLIKQCFPITRENSRLFSLACRRFTPPKTMPDPYVAAVLIATAQSQRRWWKHQDEDREEEEQIERGKKEQTGAGPNKPEWVVNLEAAQMHQDNPDPGGRGRTQSGEEYFPVVVVVQGAEHVSVFTTDVTAAFLAKLDEPGKPPALGASLDIHQQHVSFRPYKTFAGRFAGAVRDTRHRHQSHKQDAGESGLRRDDKGDSSSPFCSRQRYASADGEVVDSAGPGETDMKRKQSSGADWCKGRCKRQPEPHYSEKKARGE
ncbi:hypothetical protein SPI_06669 [Niveomyces insectorum RCEF 264]|uniref:Uncharacterized protein n=1 Tax=Niveomyces insectorum RCEF 264 TaxID=1081102 RepID=A0A167RHC1_9HYPO|nr:hypothetical protein SPI_06669 [Niveomyces insectorum RCEF 264]